MTKDIKYLILAFVRGSGYTEIFPNYCFFQYAIKDPR